MTTSKEPEAPLPLQTVCPFCRSPRILTTSDTLNASSYWRCEACGEVWNLARLQSGARRNSYKPQWR